MLISNTQNQGTPAYIYAKPLLGLDKGLRVEIMHLLLNSIAEQTTETPDLYSCFSGSWGDGMSADEYCKELREGITEPKDIDSW